MTTMIFTISIPFIIAAAIISVYLVSRIAGLGYWRSYFQIRNEHKEAKKE